MQVDALLSEAIPVPEEISGVEESLQHLKQTLLQLKSMQVRCMTTPAHSIASQATDALETIAVYLTVSMQADSSCVAVLCTLCCYQVTSAASQSERCPAGWFRAS